MAGARDQARARRLRRDLVTWYRRDARVLPWRRPDPDPWMVWVSEIMLQQTRVEAVAGRFGDFLDRYPDPASLAAADVDPVLGAWSGLGYYRRARRLHAGAGYVCERHDGRVPDDMASLRAIPGVGEYTAAAIASIAFGAVEPALDANAERVLARLFALRGNPKARALRSRLRELALAVIDPECPGDSNQALMDVGARWCRASRPDCERCPVGAHCAGRADGRPEDFPMPRTRRAVREVAMLCLVVRDAARVLLWRRDDDGGELSGMWELPGMELDAGVDPGLAARDLATAVERRTGLVVRVGGPAARTRHAIMDRRIVADAWTATVAEPPGVGEARDWGLLDEDDRRRVGVSSLYTKLLRGL